MTTIELNVWSITAEYLRRIKIGIDKALPILLEELKSLTPEDTKEMLNSYVVQRAELNWDSVVWSIGNEAEHAIYVEYGRGWVKFWYHKPKWSLFYVWEWNRTFARAVDNKREEIIKIIYNEIDK